MSEGDVIRVSLDTDLIRHFLTRSLSGNILSPYFVCTENSDKYDACSKCPVSVWISRRCDETSENGTIGITGFRKTSRANLLLKEFKMN